MGCSTSKNLRKVEVAASSRHSELHVSVDPILNSDYELLSKTNEAESIENFLCEGLANGDANETLKIILTNFDARQAFLEFLKSEQPAESMIFFEEADLIREVLLANPNESDNGVAQAEHLVEAYQGTTLVTEIRPGTLTSTVKKDITTELLKGDQTEKHQVAETITAAQSNVVTLMAMGALPRFVRSELYNRWRAREILRLYDCEGRPKRRSTPATQAQEAYALARNDFAEKAFGAMEEMEFSKLAHCSNWMTHLIGSVESLPICVSLSSADRRRFGFPLIYVNEYFEQVTGYPRSEIIGRNCRFLQDGKAEPESIERLRKALKHAKPVKTEITNFRKDGTQFTNLLAMKPIFDQTGKYRYVLGLQFPVDSEVTSLSRLKFANQMLKLLPDTVFMDKAFLEEEEMLAREAPPGEVVGGGPSSVESSPFNKRPTPTASSLHTRPLAAF